MCKVKYFNWLASLFIFYIGLNTFFVSYVQPIGFDDAFNLQIAKSLSEYFIYQSTYYPRFIYNHQVTTNGLIQYLAAFDIKLFGDRFGLALTLSLISIFTLGTLLKYSWKTFVAVVALLVSYPFINLLMTAFKGEISALGFMFLGAYYTKRHISKSEESGLIRHSLLMSSVCYGLAISTKLISGVVLPFFVFGLYYSSTNFDKRKSINAFKNTSIAYVLSLVIFALIFYFSTLHSQLFLILYENTNSDIPVSNLGLIKFIQDHFFQQSSVTDFMLKTDAFSVNWLLPLIFSSLLLLVVSSCGWIPFAIIVTLIIAVGNLNERRLFLFFAPAILIASCYIFSELKSYLEERRNYSCYANLVSSFVVISIWMYALVVGFQKMPLSFAESPNNNRCPLFSYFSLAWPNLSYAKKSISCTGSHCNNFVVGDPGEKVIEAIRNEKSPVIVSGWWQYPELQLSSKISFYNRIESSGIAKKLQGASPLLLFNPSIKSWPETSIKMCSRVIIELPDVVLCYYDISLPLNQRWGVK